MYSRLNTPLYMFNNKTLEYNLSEGTIKL